MNQIKRVTQETPCPHCGKPDWCYFLGELSVCKRQSEPAHGWIKTNKSDNEGTPYYAPDHQEIKPIRPPQQREWIYNNLQGFPTLKVRRIDYGDERGKKIWQQHLNGEIWVNGYGETDSSQISLYRWDEVQKAIAKGEKIFLVEGEPKADILRSVGFTATCNIGGSGKWRIHYSQILTKAHVVLVPDRDQPGVKHCQKIESELKMFGCQVSWLYPKPKSPFWDLKKLPPSNGLDILDWIEEDGATAEEILAAIQPQQREDHNPTAKTTDPLTSPLKVTYWNDGDISKKLQDWELMEFFDELGDRVQFDDLKGQILLDGEVLTVDEGIKFWFLRKFKLRASKQDIKDGLIFTAKQHSFNPVKQYLENCAEHATHIDIDNMATRYFGRSEPIYNRMVKMWLISAVARVLDPGCQADHTLILQSDEGRYKSTWFKVLGGEWFTDSLKDIENKDSLLTLHSNWICEFSELDRVTSKKQAGVIKHFLTQRTDHFRKPYGYEIEEQSRRAVFCGTVNPAKFLVEGTNRRFWIIPLPDSMPAIDIDLIYRERDGIWASAYQAYKQGETWWPDKEEQATINLLNQEFREIDEWRDPIYDYLEDRPFVSTFDILTKCLGLQEKEIRRAESMRVARILDDLGWTKETRKEIDGKFRRIRLRPNFWGKDGNVGKPLDISDVQDYQINSPSPVDVVNEPEKLTDYRINDAGTYRNENQTQSGFTTYTNKDTCFPMSQKISVGDRVWFKNHKDITYTVARISGNEVTIKALDKKGVMREYTASMDDLTLATFNGGNGNGKK